LLISDASTGTWVASKTHQIGSSHVDAPNPILHSIHESNQP